METIKYLLVIIIKIIGFLLSIVLAFWLVSFAFPSLRVSNLLSLDGEWLPAPGSIGTLLGRTTPPKVTTNIYQPGPAYNGYANLYTGYNVYSPDGSQWSNINTGVSGPSSSSYDTNQYQTLEASNYALRSSYLRNLSIYQGGHIYTGLSFVGEAKNTMFQNGKFPIVIVDANNYVVGVTYAEATTQWSTLGWVRFQVKINSVLPNKVACSMVFQQAMPQTNISSQPARVVIPVLCN